MGKCYWMYSRKYVLFNIFQKKRYLFLLSTAPCSAEGNGAVPSTTVGMVSRAFGYTTNEASSFTKPDSADACKWYSESGRTDTGIVISQYECLTNSTFYSAVCFHSSIF